MDGCLATDAKAGLKDEAINETACYPGESKASENVEKVENKQEVVLELPEAVKTLMKEGNDLYKMGHHSDAVLKYGLCIERLWPGRKSLRCTYSFPVTNCNPGQVNILKDLSRLFRLFLLLLRLFYIFI